MSWRFGFKKESATHEAPAKPGFVEVVDVDLCPVSPDGSHYFGSVHAEVLLAKDAEGRHSIYVGVHQCVHCLRVLVVVDSTDGLKTVWEARA